MATDCLPTDTLTEELQHFDFQIDGFSHISSNYLQYLMEDSSGAIWVSSEYAGIARLTILNEGIKRIFPEAVSLSDRSNTVRMITRLKMMIFALVPGAEESLSMIRK